MKSFFLKLALFVAVITAIMAFVLGKYGGYVDYYYPKVASPKQTSLIIGDSKPMQGIQPSVINDYFKADKSYQMPILNYAFTVFQAAYGEHYFRSIRRKVDPDTKNGLFILSVSPFEMSKHPEDDEQKHKFFEQDQLPHNMWNPNGAPNFEYLVKNYDSFHFKAIFRRLSKTHDDGWMQEDNIPTDAKSLEKLKLEKIVNYEKTALKYEPSGYRLESFDSLVDYLSKRGKVVLVRMPQQDKITEIETKFWPVFNQHMNDIAKNRKALYFDFSVNSKYDSYDGVHLGNESGAIFTKDLCDSIKKYGAR
ncbi:hypothetical protein [Flavobacterium sp.]|uniref:hypothetical protein n=1 Tax=Flavobacterium sp. TaxID=239 RepID=UPI0025BBBC91|nr:hypothetical protein [Flavobacterium sp.]